MRRDVLPNGVQILPEDEHIWRIYGYKCVAHPHTWAVALHEEPPKSLNPDWKQMPETRFPVCNACHMYVHHIGRSLASMYLNISRDDNFPRANEILERLYGCTKEEA